MSQCTVTMDMMEDNADFVQMMYEGEAQEALSNLVGVPQNAKHQQLWDLMWGYIMETGGLSNWGADPKEQVNDWANFFTHRHFNVINAKTIFIGPYRIPSLIKTVKEVIAKRNKIIKKGKVGWIEQALSPPSLLSMKVDRFGIIDKVIRKAKTITDDTRQAYAQWSKALDKINEKVGNDIIKKIDNGVITLNNSSYNGITGFKTSLGEEVILIGETDEGFQIVYKDDIPEVGGIPMADKKLIKKEALNATRQDINDALLDKIREEIVNDIMHGQLRYIVRKHIPQQGTPEFDAFLKTSDGKRILEHIDHFKKSRLEKPGYQYPYYHQTEEDSEGRSWIYVMIKQNEGARVGAETYNTYIIGYEDENGAFNSNIYKASIQAESQAQTHLLQDGWYKSDSVMTKQERINKDGEIIKGSLYKEYDLFEVYDNPPPDEAVKAIMDKVRVLRSINKKVFQKAERMIERNRAMSEEMDERLRRYYKKKINPETNKPYEDIEIEAALLNLNANSDIQSLIMNTPDGIATLNSRLQKKEENYSPIMWDDNTLFKMIDKAKESIHMKLKAIDRSTEMGEQQWLDNMVNLQYLIRISYLSSGNLTEQQWLTDNKEILEELKLKVPLQYASLKEGSIAVHTKHRVAWTDPRLRRKDDSVMGDYFDKTFRAIHQNELVNELKSAHIKNLEVGEPLSSDVLSYMNNRVKKATGDKSVTAGIGKIKYGYEDMASWLNGLPKWIRRRRHWRPEDAEKLILRVNGIMTSRFLGSDGALHNRTQVVNNIIHYGLGLWWQAKREMKNTEKWNPIIANTGVENLLSMFNDIMLQSGEVDGYDFAFVPGTESLLGVPIPSHNMKQFVKLLRAGKDSFVESGDSHIDSVLMKLIYKEKGKKAKADLRGLEEYDKRRAYWMAEGKDINIDNLTTRELELLKEKREAYIDIFLAKQGEQTEKIMKARFEKLLGKISDAKLKKMVTWKLTWWWGGKTGKELFTFTEGEQYMRRLTAVMALLQAKEMGLLPQMEDGSDIYMSPDAVKIARDAVYQSMFGMSPVYMGDAFDGAGRGLMQYKAYPLQQTIHDYEVWKAFNNANRHIGHGDMARRLIQAHWDVLKQMGWRMKGEKALGRYNPKDKYLDHEALAMLRLLYTRVLSTGIATSIGLIPFLGSAFRMTGFSSGLGALRSAENPVVAITFRLLVWGLLLGMGMDEDELEDRAGDIGSRISMLLLPVIIGSFVRDGIKSFQYWSEVLD